MLKTTTSLPRKPLQTKARNPQRKKPLSKLLQKALRSHNNQSFRPRNLSRPQQKQQKNLRLPQRRPMNLRWLMSQQPRHHRLRLPKRSIGEDTRTVTVTANTIHIGDGRAMLALMSALHSMVWPSSPLLNSLGPQDIRDVTV